MKKFVSKVSTIPSDLQRLIEAFQGQGALRIEGGEVMFEFEADDLWEAREVIDTVLGEVEGYYYRSDFEFDKAEEIGE